MDVQRSMMGAWQCIGGVYDGWMGGSMIDVRGSMVGL